jgi:hypothetical protein
MAAGIHIAVDLVCCALIFVLGMYAGHRLARWLAERMPAELLPEQSKCEPPPKPQPARYPARVSEFAPKPRLRHWPKQEPLPRGPVRDAPPPPVMASQAAAKGRLPELNWELRAHD